MDKAIKHSLPGDIENTVSEFMSYLDTVVTWDELDSDDVDQVSDCCGAEVYDDHDICSECKDHCGREDEDM